MIRPKPQTAWKPVRLTYTLGPEALNNLTKPVAHHSRRWDHKRPLASSPRAAHSVHFFAPTSRKPSRVRSGPSALCSG